jgi:hypothetical protein
MTPEAALAKQIEMYRQMTGEQRLAIALGLHELSCEVARAGIRHQHPEADAAEVERLLRRRIELGRSGTNRSVTGLEELRLDSSEQAVKSTIAAEVKAKK